MLCFLLVIISILESIDSRTVPNYSMSEKTLSDYSFFTYKHTPNFSSDHDRKRIHWYDLLFISVLVLLFLLLLFCLHYQQSFFNSFCFRLSRKKSNEIPLNQKLIIRHATDPMIQSNKSMYLTVPQPSYVHH